MSSSGSAELDSCGNGPSIALVSATFHYFFSDALKRGLENTINFKLGDEQGMEAFYNFALTRWFRIAADLQVIEPGDRSFKTEVYAGISGQVRF